MHDGSDFTTDSGHLHDPADQEPGATHQSMEPPPGWDVSSVPGMNPDVAGLVGQTGAVDHQVETILAGTLHPTDPDPNPADTTTPPFNVAELPGMNSGVAGVLLQTDEIGRYTTDLGHQIAGEQQPSDPTHSTPPGSGASTDPAATDDYLNKLEEIQQQNQYLDGLIQGSQTPGLSG